MTDHSESVVHPIPDSPFRQGSELPPAAQPGDLFLLRPPGEEGAIHVWSRDHGWLRLGRRPAIPDDRTLARLATEAGLCVAKCWDIDLAMDPSVVADDAQWVAAAGNSKERRRRQESVDVMHARAQEALKKLRRFAELVQEQPHA